MQSFKLFQFCGRKAYAGPERRRKPRIYYPIPIKARPAGRAAERFELNTYANNLSAGGFSAPSEREFLPGQRLFFIVRFSLDKSLNARVTAIAAHGTVLRSEVQLDGSYVFASSFDRYRFL
jgi:hypothetical protein